MQKKLLMQAMSHVPPGAWRDWLEDTAQEPYFQKLAAFYEEECARHATVYPRHDQIFQAFAACPLEKIRVVIVGQDPYHGPSQAHGLCFSVQKGVKIPPSLKNIYKELQADLGIEPPEHGCLEGWARQGVFLLNSVLTVRAGEAFSHKDQGWEQLTSLALAHISTTLPHCVFVLWGAPAQKKQLLIDTQKHTIIKSAHPSPLSAHRGFLGSRPFSAILEALHAHQQAPIHFDDLP